MAEIKKNDRAKSMSDKMYAKFIAEEEVLIGVLDLCGTTAMYERLDLKKQVDRISHVVGDVWTELSNTFGESQKSLYVHLFADSVVIAQRSRKDPDDCLNKLVRYLLTLQFQMLRYNPPALCRSMVRKGKYYGILFNHETKIDDILMNFSLVGGPTIVAMDKELKGLPTGVYIDRSLALEYEESTKLVQVEAARLDFVKPPENFLSFEEIFGNHDLDQWVEELIEASEHNEHFINKIKPWQDAVAGRSALIRRSPQTAS
jgi:hypothetical protein